MLLNGKHLILIVILIVLVCANSLPNGFVYDDFNVIVSNDFIKSFRNLPLLFDRRYLTPPDELNFDLRPYSIHSGETTYRPVATLSYFIDYALFRMNPSGYRLTNICIHITSAVLLYLLLNLLFSNPSVSLFSAILFGIHPASVEVLNCTGLRPSSLVLLFCLLALILYFMFKEAAGKFKFIYLAGSLSSAALALFTKEVAVILPLALLLADYYRADFNFRKVLAGWRYYSLYLLVIVLYLAVYLLLMPPAQKIFVAIPAGIYSNILRTFDILGIYLKALFIPGERVFIPPIALVKSYFNIALGLSVFLLTVYIFIKRRFYPKEVSFGLLWFFLWLFPMNNFLNTFRILLAYRYLYLPLAGFATALGWLLAKAWQKRSSFLPKMDVLRRSLVAGYLGAFAIFTISSNAYWKNELLLYMYLAEKYPSSLHAHFSLGRALSLYGNYEEAAAELNYVISRYHLYKQPILSKYDLANTYYNLASIYRQMGQLDKAIEACQRALEIFPGHPKLQALLKALKMKGEK